MKTSEILREIQRLPVNKRFYVVEETIKSIKNEGIKNQMELAVDELLSDYSTDKGLIAFTSLDFEDFYETK